MSFFRGYVIALEIEAAAVLSAWLAVRLWQVLGFGAPVASRAYNRLRDLDAHG